MRNFISYPFIKQRNNKRREKLINKDFTILSSECAGGVIYHDLGLRFDSPTINLWFKPDDYILFLSDLNYYLSTDKLVEEQNNSLTYPVGILGEGNKKIRLFFQHYESFKIAKQKWNIRKKRVHLDNLFIIMTDRDGATKETLCKFDALKFENKIILTGKKYPEIKSSYCIHNCLENGHLGDIFHRSLITGKSKLDTFNFVDFLNNGYK